MKGKLFLKIVGIILAVVVLFFAVTSLITTVGKNSNMKKIESFEQYKQNSGAYFPRINKIFDNIIRYYKREAKSMDEDALLADMRW